MNPVPDEERDEHVVPGADEFLEVGENARKEGAEIGGAMVRAIGSHRRLGLGQ